MLIKAPPTYIEEVSNLIESIGYIDPEFKVHQVEIHQSDSLNNLIELESFCGYAEKNGISDLGYALASVCNAHNIDCNGIGFIVEEATLYDNIEMIELTSFLSEQGYKIYIQPISHKSPYCTELDKVLSLDEAYDYKDSINLQAYSEGTNKHKRLAAARRKSRKLKSRLHKTSLKEEKAYLLRQLDKTNKLENDLGQALGLIN